MTEPAVSEELVNGAPDSARMVGRSEGSVGDRAEVPRTSTFSRRLLQICAASFALRLSYVLLVTKSAPLAGDALYYSAQGQAIAAGRGFAHPFYFAGTMPAADHPPLAAIVMALGPLIVGSKSMVFGMPLFVFVQRLTLVLIGTATVAVVGATARRTMSVPASGELDRDQESISGRAAQRDAGPVADRVGLLAACFAAVSPSLWVNDGILMSESVAALALAAVLWVALVAWGRPGIRQWAMLGGAIGLAALARAESVSLLAVLAAPMVLLRHRGSARKILFSGVSAAIACLLVCATWLIPNVIRFEERALFSTSDGLLWLGANCPDTYSGDWRGFWTLGCLRHFDTDGNGRNDEEDLHSWSPFDRATEDQSQISRRYQAAAFQFIGGHKRAFVKLSVVRVARTWGIWRPDQMAEYNRGEGRSLAVSWMAWADHIIMMPLAAVGLVALRRAGRPTWPFVAQGIAVTLISALVYGLARFRLGWDVAACILAAIGVDRSLRRFSTRVGASRE